DLSENDHYLRLISDVNTRWNSSYLAWIQLEKIHDYIDVISSEINPKEIDLTNPTTDCNDLIGKVKSALYIAMKHYWNIPQDEGLIAAFLDPR
ncbi:15989_t:CDS:2, partial [Funneliformis caledonium]